MNCKPGDLAYVIDGGNVGAVVEVIRVDQEATDFLGVHAWLVHSRSRLPAIDYRTGDITHCCTAFVADHRLRPISGVPVHEEFRNEVTA